jgi:hypothetical protein
MQRSRLDSQKWILLTVVHTVATQQQKWNPCPRTNLHCVKGSQLQHHVLALTSAPAPPSLASRDIRQGLHCAAIYQSVRRRSHSRVHLHLDSATCAFETKHLLSDWTVEVYVSSSTMHIEDAMCESDYHNLFGTPPQACPWVHNCNTLVQKSDCLEPDYICTHIKLRLVYIVTYWLRLYIHRSYCLHRQYSSCTARTNLYLGLLH